MLRLAQRASPVCLLGAKAWCDEEARRVFEPSVPYPGWDSNWDGLQSTFKRQRQARVPTRHIILIRHGQYDETHKDDSLRTLTALGRRQAEKTGERLSDLLEKDARVRIRCSTMTRAKETFDIIKAYLPRAHCVEPDSRLAEGRPAQAIPGRPFDDKVLDADGPRIEAAFRSLFYRATDDLGADHDFDIVVCHGNVIRYFVMRALQLPPEAWLRLCTFNCSMTYFVVRPSGSVSLRAMGDISHLPKDLLTFSAHTGIEW